ncbi:hypothetical protein BTBSAS_80126 [Brochothrix thermosphacta]|uniref:Uncharacterized protein n=1 Tax=Brochothrix thermosphacta TaxID=2756 RepID=A0A2X0QQD2_BROTH|nr:hypothetical protein BTBSAS_80126 [Brochothrix thermosphacta]
MAENLGYSAIKFTLYGKKLTKINKEVLTIFPQTKIRIMAMFRKGKVHWEL